MNTQVAATYIGGQFKPDENLPLPEAARVTLTIELLDEDQEPESQPPPDAKKSLAALKALQARLKERPIHGGGKRYTRDELHERR
jgi:hypothetical protein